MLISLVVFAAIWAATTVPHSAVFCTSECTEWGFSTTGPREHPVLSEQVECDPLQVQCLLRESPTADKVNQRFIIVCMWQKIKKNNKKAMEMAWPTCNALVLSKSLFFMKVILSWAWWQYCMCNCLYTMHINDRVRSMSCISCMFYLSCKFL